jgi:hypothetical protein
VSRQTPSTQRGHQHTPDCLVSCWCGPAAAAAALRFAQKLVSLSDVFRLQDSQAAAAAAAAGAPSVLTLAPQYTTTEARTQAVAGVLSELRQQHGLLSGWRDELYPVTPAFDAEPLLLIERAAAPYFGIRAYGVHVNGYVQQPDGSKALWVARRSKSKQTWPGKLDHIVAGGQVRVCPVVCQQGTGRLDAWLLRLCVLLGLNPQQQQASDSLAAAQRLCVQADPSVCPLALPSPAPACCPGTHSHPIPLAAAALRPELCGQRRQGVLGGGGRTKGPGGCSAACRLCQLCQHVGGGP